MDYVLWIQLVLFVVLMVLSGFFSSSETAMFSLNNIQLEQMRRDKNPRIGLIERMLSEPRRLIVTILIGNEFVNVAASVISASIVIQLFGAENKLINLFIMVPILLLVGEITPKTLAIRNNVAFASFESAPIDFFARMIYPIRWVVRQVSEFFTTLIVGKERSRGNIITEDMVRTLAHEAVGKGALDKTEAQFIDHIFDFGNITIEELITPRAEINFISLDATVPEMLSLFQQTRQSRLPVYKSHRDNIVGILHARDLLSEDLDEVAAKGEGLRGLLRKPYFIPETKLASEVFDKFRKRKRSIALTVDEYGGITGLVTMEDLLECIFGDIPSPSDIASQSESDIEHLEHNRFSVPGNISVHDFNAHFKAHLPSDEFETLAGMILHAFGELPAEREAITLGNLRFSVTKIEHQRIAELLVEDLSAIDTRETPKEEATPDEPQQTTESEPGNNQAREVKE